MARGHQVILGASAAGLAALEAIRGVDPACPVTVVSKEPGPLYSRVGLTHFIAREVSYDGMQMRGPDYFQRMNATAILGVGARRVDAKARTVMLDDGQTLGYENLLVATGSSAVVPPIPGTHLRHIFPCITNVDARNIDAMIAWAKEAVVIGAGLIGIQAVDALAHRGLKVAVIERLGHLMPLMMDATGARIIEQELRDQGHIVRTGISAKEILGKNEKVTGVRLESGEEIPCQLLVMAAGVKPNLEFLQGTAVKVNRGVVVDAQQRSSAEGIYAAGDVAETVDMLSGERVVNAIWPEALNQGRIAGLSMVGVPTAYGGSMAMNTTAVLGIPLASLGLWDPPEKGYEVVSKVEPHWKYYRKLVFKGDDLVGAVLVGRINEEAGILHNMIRTRTRFFITADQLKQGIVTWGKVIRANDRMGAVAAR